MDPDSRVDLFISFHGSELLSDGITTDDLVTATKKRVLKKDNKFGIKPFIFLKSTAQLDEIADAVLQTRPGGLALFLLTPTFFSNWMRVAELRAFLKMNSCPNVHLKLRFICLKSSAKDILKIAREKSLPSTLSSFELRTDISFTSIPDTSADLCDVVFGAWECRNGVVSSHDLPTVFGHTRRESFLALQRVFTDEDLPSFRTIFRLSTKVGNMFDAFSMATEVTQHSVEKLYDFIDYRKSQDAEEQRRIVNGYERKWVDSNRLGWQGKVREDLLRLFKTEESGASQASSSSRPQKRLRMIAADVHEPFESDPHKPRATEEVFKPYFDEPPLLCNVVLDFTSGYENDNPMTAEGQLLRKVLEPLKKNVCGTVSASGSQRSATHGMGGVGKTIALKGLCYNEKVKQFYHDGISYLEFGQDADVGKVIKQVARCVLAFGGRKKAKEIEESSSLSDVVESGAGWLRGRTVLLICDDLWANSNKYGYLQDMTALLRDAPKSKLVISTRDKNIADSANSAGGSVEFAPLDVEGLKARAILLANLPNICNDTEIRGKTADDSIRRILNICAGLPLALAIAGQGLRKSVRHSNSLSIGARLYCEDLEQDIDPIMVDGFDHYPGLAKVIDSSLKQCDEWGKSDEVVRKYGTLDMISMFKGLCVQEKQSILPKRVLAHLWGTDNICTKKVIEKLADWNLTSRVASGPSTQHEFGLRMHDLVLERCQQMAGNKRTEWHKKIVDAYAQKLVDKRICEANDESEKSRPWWCAEDDGYILANLSKHLVSSEQAGELELLLCDIRWIMHRMKTGGWAPLNSDFEHLFGAQKYASSGMRRVHNVLQKSFPYEREQSGALAFCVFAHLSQVERKETHTARLLSSIDHQFPKPWLRPANRLIAVRDSREEWKEKFSSFVEHMIVDWKKGTMLVHTFSELSLWSTLDRRPIWTIPHRATAIAMNRDGKLIATGSYNGSIRRWHADTGAEIGNPLIGLESRVVCIAVSDVGKVIVSLSYDGTIQRWDAHSGAQLGDLPNGYEDYVCCFVLCEDRIVTGSIDGTIRLWDTLSGAPIGDPFIGHEGTVTCIAVSEDGKTIVSGSTDCTIRRWCMQTKTQIGKPLIGHEHAVSHVLSNEDGNTIVSFSKDFIRRWDAQRGAQIGDPLNARAYQVRSFAMSKDGKVIVLGSGTGKIWQFEVQSGAQIGDPLIGHEGAVECIAVSEDGKTIISTSNDNTIRQWDAQRVAQASDPLIGQEEDVKCAKISFFGTLTISGAWDGTIPRLNAHSGAGNPFIGHGDARCIALGEDRNIIVLWADGNTIRIWNAGSEPQDPLIGHQDAVICIAVSEDGKTVVSGSYDCTIRRWNAESGAQIGDPLIGHKGSVTCIAVSQDSKTIVSGSRDRTIRRWHAQSGVQMGDPLIGPDNFVSCVAVSKDGKIVVSGSRDGTVRRWEFQSGVGIGNSIIQHQGSVRCISVSGDGEVVMSAYNGGAIRRWDRQAQLRAGGSGSSQGFTRTPTGMVCLAMNLDSQVAVVRLADDRIAICRMVT